MFQKRFKQLREEFGYSQEYIAKLLNISRQAVSSYENSNREPEYNSLIKIADLFDVSIDFLLGRTDIRVPFVETELKNRPLANILNVLSSKSELASLIIDLTKVCNEYIDKK